MGSNTDKSETKLKRSLAPYSRRRVHEILEVAGPGDRTSRLVDLCILSLILLNVAAVILESVPSYKDRYGDFFGFFEQVSVAIFTAEYVLRLWSCVEDENYASSIGGRLRFAITPQALIDLVAVLPAYLGLGDARFFRILRMLKLARYINAMRMFQRVVIKKRAELGVTLMVICIMLIFTSCVIYLAEREANEKLATIPDAMWWSIVTLTTVGYGDIHVETGFGRFLAGFVAVIGIGMFALPTAILGAAFLQEMESTRKEGRCPHCGEEI